MIPRIAIRRKELHELTVTAAGMRTGELLENAEVGLHSLYQLLEKIDCLDSDDSKISPWLLLHVHLPLA